VGNQGKPQSKRNGYGLIPNTAPAVNLEELWEIRENLSPREMVMV
jgi:hypothetical protein